MNVQPLIVPSGSDVKHEMYRDAVARIINGATPVRALVMGLFMTRYTGGA